MKYLYTLALLLIATTAFANQAGDYPNAQALGGSERILATQSGLTVNLTPAQIRAFLNGQSGIWTGTNTFQGTFNIQQPASNTGANLFLLGGPTGATINRIRYNSNSTANNSFCVRDDAVGADRVCINSIGDVTINAPTSGSTVTMTSASATTTAQVINGTSGGIASVEFAANAGSSIGFVGTAGAANQGQTGAAAGDTFVRSNSGAVLLGNGTTIYAKATSSGIGLPAFTVSTLPTCNSTSKGSLAYVTDASSPTYNGTLTGGSTTVVPAFCNGTTWTAH